MDCIEINSEMLTDGTRVVKPIGQLDAFAFTDFKRYFEELCNQAKDIEVVVDLSGVSYISSSGWSVLLSRRKALQRLGGNLAIAGLSVEIQRVYESMKITKMLPAAGSITEAAQLLRLPQAN